MTTRTTATLTKPIKSKKSKISFTEMKKEVQAHVIFYFDLANELYKPAKPFIVPPVHFTLRGKVAGRACYKPRKIKINSILLTENYQEMMDRTVPHEVAHIIVHNLYNMLLRRRSRSGRSIRVTKPHGEEWKKIMKDLGVKDMKRCHSYDVTRSIVRQRVRYQYTCSCGTPHNMSSIKHNRAQRGRLYVCRKCKTPVKFSGEMA